MVQNFYHLTIIEATVLLGTLRALEKALYLCHALCLATNLYHGDVQGVPWTSYLGFCPHVQCELWDLLLTGVCLSKLSNQSSLPQVDFISCSRHISSMHEKAYASVVVT